MKDNCQICHGARGGVPGNENVEDGVVMCDYCTADFMEGRPIVGWQPIATAPTDSKIMFVVKGFNVTGYSKHPYTTDPYCVWSERGNFIRWPHTFPPTHWLPLPPAP